jgi:hypothetical protein
MRRFTWTLGCLVLLGFLLPAKAGAGWVIEQVIRSRAGAGAPGGQPDRHMLTMSANRMKTMIQDRAGKPTAAWMVDLDAQTITSVDYEQRVVSTGTVAEYAEAIRGAAQAAGGQMAEAMKQMQEAMKDMPPEQRKMMEQMMRQSMPGGGPAAPSAEPCREPRVEVRPTGQTARIAGYSAARFDILEDGKLAQELWVSKELTAWREMDAKKMERFTQELVKAMQALPGCGRDRGRGPGADLSGRAWKLAGEGYPVRIVDHAIPDGTIVEVVKAESRAVPAAEFQPPAGFKRQSFKEMMGGPR